MSSGGSGEADPGSPARRPWRIGRRHRAGQERFQASVEDLPGGHDQGVGRLVPDKPGRELARHDTPHSTPGQRVEYPQGFMVNPVTGTSAATTLATYWEFLQANIAGAGTDAMRSAAESLHSRTARDKGVRDEVNTLWSSGWVHFDTVIFAMEQNGLAMLQRSGATDDDHSPVRDALSLLHSSATMTLHEIRHLLLGGLWVGAAARWRALHEVAVTATLIAKNGADIAQRYLDHGFVVQTKRLAEFHAVHTRGPVPAATLSERLAEAESITKAHALDDQTSPFSAQYGWAIPLMAPRKSGRQPAPSFDALERLAGMQEVRLLVVSAHGHVHNDPAGVRAAVLMEEGSWSLSPIARFTETVARPALMSVIHLVPATHLGFEPDLNPFSKLLGLLGAAICENASKGVAAFEAKPEASDSPRNADG